MIEMYNEVLKISFFLKYLILTIIFYIHTTRDVMLFVFDTIYLFSIKSCWDNIKIYSYRFTYRIRKKVVN